MILDCFTYFDEEIILDLRFNILNPFVNKFIITEGSFDHRGKKRELNFNINKYKEFKDKIIYIPVEDFPDKTDPWSMLRHQRNKVLEIIKSYDDDTNLLKRLILCYSLPNYENIAVYLSNNVLSLNDLQQCFHSLLNGEHTNKDYLFSISRADFVFNSVVESLDTNQAITNYSDIISQAMNGELISYGDFKIAMKELLPEKNLIMDASCEFMPFELQNIIIEHNKNNYLTKINFYYNRIKEHDDCIMLFDLPTTISNYSMQIKSIEGFELYYRI